jgi:hypothetical protein
MLFRIYTIIERQAFSYLPYPSRDILYKTTGSELCICSKYKFNSDKIERRLYAKLQVVILWAIVHFNTLKKGGKGYAGF